MRSEGLVPDGWRAVRLGDVADVAFSGVDKKIVDGEEQVQLCNYTDVFYNRRIRPGMELMAATANTRERDRYRLRKGDVLFTKDSETPDEIGISAYVTEDMPNVLCGYHLGLARPRCGVVEGAYLTSALQSRESRRQFARVANGVTRFGLTLGATTALPILLPPLPEQRAIAGVLDAIDEAIERTEAVIAATERLRDSLLHELLTRGVPGWHSEWKEVAGVGTVPACWEVVRLGEVCASAQYGAAARAYPFDPQLPRYVRITDVTDDGRLRTEDARSANPAQVTGYELEPGDLLFARSGATVGKTYLYRGADGPCVYAGYLIRFRPLRDRVLPKYLELMTHSQTYDQWVASMFRAGAQPNINAAEYSSLRFALPPMTEQRAIAGGLDGIDEAIDSGRAEREGLQAMKASAADALLTGRLRITTRERTHV